MRRCSPAARRNGTNPSASAPVGRIVLGTGSSPGDAYPQGSLCCTSNKGRAALENPTASNPDSPCPAMLRGFVAVVRSSQPPSTALRSCSKAALLWAEAVAAGAKQSRGKAPSPARGEDGSHRSLLLAAPAFPGSSCDQCRRRVARGSSHRWPPRSLLQRDKDDRVHREPAKEFKTGHSPTVRLP